jgi:hypothetical protein
MASSIPGECTRLLTENEQGSSPWVPATVAGGWSSRGARRKQRPLALIAQRKSTGLRNQVPGVRISLGVLKAHVEDRWRPGTAQREADPSIHAQGVLM